MIEFFTDHKAWVSLLSSSMNKLFRHIFILGAILFLYSSCTHEAEDVLGLQKVCFERDVLPIFQSSCGISNCHDAITAEEDYILTDYAGILKGVVPFKSYESEVYKVLVSNEGDDLMPPENPLPLTARKIIRLWIDQGAENIPCPSSSDIGDDDGDGILNYLDNCPQTPNTDQSDVDDDGVGDLCDDEDNDGVIDILDNCPNLYNPGQEDADLDGIGNSCDIDYVPSGIAEVCFERDILPIFISGCGIIGCHDPGSAEGDYVLTDYANIISKDFFPGNPANTKIYKVITEPINEDAHMPPLPYPSLTTAQIDSIENWILAGGLNENCGDLLCDLINVTYQTILPIIQNNCRGCHSGDQPEGSLRLINYSDIASIAANGKLEGVIKNLYNIPMPPGFMLTDCEIQKLDEWIRLGYPEN